MATGSQDHFVEGLSGTSRIRVDEGCDTDVNVCHEDNGACFRAGKKGGAMGTFYRWFTIVGVVVILCVVVLPILLFLVMVLLTWAPGLWTPIQWVYLALLKIRGVIAINGTIIQEGYAGGEDAGDIGIQVTIEFRTPKGYKRTITDKHYFHWTIPHVWQERLQVGRKVTLLYHPRNGKVYSINYDEENAPW